MEVPISKPLLTEEEIKAITDVLRSGRISQGEKVREFEKEFAKYHSVKHGIATSSGTSALKIALEAAGIKKGDEVITTPFTFIATSNSILYNQGIPVFADIDEDTFNINPEEIRKQITPKTKALLVVHLYGLPCKMDEILEIKEEHGLVLIEDCAQALGAEYKGKKVGSFGDVSAFSFYPTKNITTGEGGMVLTNKEEIAEKARLIRNHGQKENYRHEIIGYNYRMTDMQAALGLVQLKKLDEMNEKRRRNAIILTELLRNTEGIKTPVCFNGAKHVYNQYTIKAEKRDKLFEFLNKNGIKARIYYDRPVHMQPAYQKLGFKKGLCPVAEKVSEQVLSLPVYPLLEPRDMENIAEIVKRGLK